LAGNGSVAEVSRIDPFKSETLLVIIIFPWAALFDTLCSAPIHDCSSSGHSDQTAGRPRRGRSSRCKWHAETKAATNWNGDCLIGVQGRLNRLKIAAAAGPQARAFAGSVCAIGVFISTES